MSGAVCGTVAGYDVLRRRVFFAVSGAWKRTQGIRPWQTSATCLRALLILYLSGCSLAARVFTTPDSAKVAGYMNDYWYYDARYKALGCETVRQPVCVAADPLLTVVKADLEDAAAALARGGKARLQMRKLKADVVALGKVGL